MRWIGLIVLGSLTTGLVASCGPSSSAEPPTEPVEAPSVPADPPPAQVLHPNVALGEVSHSLDLPVRSLALGKPRVAALVVDGSQLVPWWIDSTEWAALPLPEAIALTTREQDTVRIHFGRNDKPRILGSRSAESPEQVYLRYRGSRWVADTEEVTELMGAPKAALFGVLGHDDPEVVCKAGGICILKRLTGWQRMDAGPGTPRVDLQGPLAFAIHPQWVAQLTGLSWTERSRGAPLAHARGAWGDEKTLWISDDDGEISCLHHHDGTAWTTQPTPVSGPRQMWGTGPADVWLAGASGLAHFDGSSWSRVEGVEGPLHEVLGRGREVWAGGESGVWLLERAER